jgi:hypothetical protein
MANPVRINAATLNRPGVFVTQASTGGLPQPLATHAVGYLFGTTPTEDYYGEDALNAYSVLEPYKPTQVGSVADFVDKVGGTIPVGNKGALASYDAVKAFFDNVGVNGILYFTRVSPTPETVIDLGASSAGAGYNAFAIKINGRYFGTSIGVNDPDGDDIKVITTTALVMVTASPITTESSRMPLKPLPVSSESSPATPETFPKLTGLLPISSAILITPRLSISITRQW